MSCFIWEMWFLSAFPTLSLWSIMGRWQRWSRRRWWILVQGHRCHYDVLSSAAWETLPLYKMAAAPQHGSGWKEQKQITFWQPAQNVETFICCLCVCVCVQKSFEKQQSFSSDVSSRHSVHIFTQGKHPFYSRLSSSLYLTQHSP